MAAKEGHIPQWDGFARTSTDGPSTALSYVMAPPAVPGSAATSGQLTSGPGQTESSRCCGDHQSWRCERLGSQGWSTRANTSMKDLARPSSHLHMAYTSYLPCTTHSWTNQGHFFCDYLPRSVHFREIHTFEQKLYFSCGLQEKTRQHSTTFFCKNLMPANSCSWLHAAHVAVVQKGRRSGKLQFKCSD